MITCPQCREELAEYALGHSSAEISAAMDEHLAACPVCRHELAALEATWSALPMALPPSPPSADLFDRIVAKIDAGAAPRPALVAAPRASQSLLSHRQRVASYVLAASILIGLTAGYLVMLAMPRGDAAAIASVEQLAQRLGDLQRREADRLLQSERVRVVSLHRPETPTASQAFVVWDLAARQWHFYASDLPAPPAGSVYQLWVATTDGTLLPGPTFSVNDAGLGSVVGDFPTLITGDAAKAVVTIEPTGGSKSPSGETVLEAAL